MPKNKKFAPSPAAEALAKAVSEGAAKDRELRFLPVNHKVLPTPKGVALFLFVGRTDYGLMPDQEDLRAVVAIAAKALKAMKVGEMAVAAMPPVVRLHTHGDSVHLVVGDAAHGIFPRARDLELFHGLMLKTLRGHGRVSVTVSAEHVVASDTAKTWLRGWSR